MLGSRSAEKDEKTGPVWSYNAWKAIGDAVTKLAGISELLDDDRKKWSEFTDYVQQHIDPLTAILADREVQTDEIRLPIERLKGALGNILSEATSFQPHKTLGRATSIQISQDKIDSLRQKFDVELNSFMLHSVISTRLDAAKTSDSAREMNTRFQQRHEEVDVRYSGPDAVHHLPLAEGMSWDPLKTCMAGTRKEFLFDAWSWIKASDTAEHGEVLWIVDVAGSGKSAIAHTICQQAKHEGVHLLASFFFDSGFASRNNPDRVVTTLVRNLAGLDERIAEAMSNILRKDPALRSASIIRQFIELLLDPSVLEHCARDRLYLIVLDALDEGYNRSIIDIFTSHFCKLPGRFRVVVTSRPEREIVHAFRNVPHIQERGIEIRRPQHQDDVALYMTKRFGSVASKNRKMPPWPTLSKQIQLIQKSEGLFQWAATVMDVLNRSCSPEAEIDAILALRNYSSPEQAMDALYTNVLNALPWADPNFDQGYRIYMGAILVAKEPLSCSTLRDFRMNGSVNSSAIFENLGSLLTGFDSEEHPVQVIHESVRDFITRRASPPLYISERAASRMLALHCLELLNRELPVRESHLQLDWLEDPNESWIPPVKVQQLGDSFHYACSFWINHLVDVEHVTPKLEAQVREFLSTSLLGWIKLSACLGKVQTLQTVAAWLKKHFPQVQRSSWLVGKLSRPQVCTLEQSDMLSHVYNFELAKKLHRLSRLLWRDGRLEQALLVAEDGVHILRYPSFAGIPTAEDWLGKTLIAASSSLLGMGRIEESLAISHEALVIHRKLCSLSRKPHPKLWTRRGFGHNVSLPFLGRDKRAGEVTESYHPGLVSSLHMFSVGLSRMGKREAALTAIEEAVALYRELATQDLNGGNTNLARSLGVLSNCLSAVGKREAAMMAIEEAVTLKRQQETKQPNSPNTDLALMLIALSECMSHLGRREAALQAIEEAVMRQREQAIKRPDVFNDKLAMSLNNLSIRLLDVGRLEEALTAIQECVMLQRELTRKQRQWLNVDQLARSLLNLSRCLTGVGKRDAALTVIEEAVKLYRTLVGKRPEAFTPHLALSLNNLSIQLSDVGKREAALATIQEAVKMYRGLAGKRPDAFNADLARSLNNLSNRLSEVGKREAALIVIEEAVELYRNLVGKLPEAFTPLLGLSLYNLSKRLSDVAILEAALSAIEESVNGFRELEQKQPDTFTTDLAGTLVELSARLSSLGRHGEAVTIISESVDLWRKLSEKHPNMFNGELAEALNQQSRCLSQTSQDESALSAVEESILLLRHLAHDQPAKFNVDLAQSLSTCTRSLSALGQHDKALIAMEEALAYLRPLALGLPTAFNRDLKKQLLQLSSVLVDLGRAEDARSAAVEAEALDVS